MNIFHLPISKHPHWRALLLVPVLTFSGLACAQSEPRNLLPSGLSAQADTLTDRYNYAEALQKTQLFYEAQRSGNVTGSRLNWVGSSYVNDGADVGRNLSGGLYDAGDTVKWNDTMSFAAAMIAWGAIEHRATYVSTGQLPFLKSNVRWVADYYVNKCFVDTGNRSTYRIYTHIMNPSVDAGDEDHSYWAAKEIAHLRQPVRRSYYADAGAPQSDVVANMAATLAAASMVFRADGDTGTADTYLTKAKRLFDFANTYRAAGTKKNASGTILGTANTNFYRDLLWSAAWLHRAELAKNARYGNSYLTIANQIYDSPSMNSKLEHWGDFGYSDYSKGAYVLLWKLTGAAKWKTELDNYCDWWIPEVGKGDSAKPTPGRLAYHSAGTSLWGSLRNANNQAWIWFQYSDSLPTGDIRKTRMHDYAVEQVNYALGSNPLNRAYLIGFNPPGKTVTTTPHHRTAHGTWRGFDYYQAGDDQLLTARHTLYGALIGGPDADDSFPVGIGDAQHDEVALDYNAGITNNLARMTQEFGGTALSNFPTPETPSGEFAAKVSRNLASYAVSPSGYTVHFNIENRTAWPARATTGLKARYFFTLDTGATLADVIVENPYNSDPMPQTVTGPKQWSGSVYYIELTFPNTTLYPAGGTTYKNEGKFRIRYTNGATIDLTNDWSATGSGTDVGKPTVTTYIPIYDSNGNKLYGNEPPANANR